MLKHISSVHLRRIDRSLSFTQCYLTFKTNLNMTLNDTTTIYKVKKKKCLKLHMKNLVKNMFGCPNYDVWGVLIWWWGFTLMVFKRINWVQHCCVYPPTLQALERTALNGQKRWSISFSLCRSSMYGLLQISNQVIWDMIYRMVFRRSNCMVV